MTYEEKDKIIQGLMRDFDALNIAQMRAGEIERLGFVNYLGEKINIETYLQKRLYEITKN